MARANWYWSFLFFVTFSALATAVHADASAIAYGSDDSWGWVTGRTQQDANKRALENCNKVSLQKDCKLDTTKALAQAKGGGRVSWGRSAISMADAKKKALDGCREDSCKITSEIRDPGFYSLAKAIPDKDGRMSYFLTYGATNSDEADKDALQSCEERASGKCQIAWSGAISGNHTVESTPKASPVVSAKSCRPQTSTIRCSSQCTNGNCIVSYENGCKMRVQVQSVFDGFSNQWKYPAPSC